MTVSVSLPDQSARQTVVAVSLATSPNSSGDGDLYPDGFDALLPSHPLGVKPSGNALTATSNIRPAIGTLAMLPDEQIALLLEYLDSATLLALGATCRALHAFTRSEELWKALFVQSPPPSFTWRRTWRSTYLGIPASESPSIDCSNLFSDTLHRPFYCAHISLSRYADTIPARNRISRLPDLSPMEFQESWTDRPFILTEPVKQWPVFREWSTETLLERYGETKFRAEAVDWPLKIYVDYMNNNSDESPLYLFDRGFVEKMGVMVGDPTANTTRKGEAGSSEGAEDAAYTPPACFGEDFFAVLGARRPDSRWLIVGPERSGSTFHKDPNATSAWNAVLRGSKYWIMFPSSTTASNGRPLPPPPGVFVSADQSEVTSPLSIAEWLLTFHAEARRSPHCIEGICHDGEVLHVPSGWWHLVVNLTPAIAITQNFIPHAHLTAALDFLKYKPDQVSGFRMEGFQEGEDPYSAFVERMRERHPVLLDEAVAAMESAHANDAEKKKRKWDAIVHQPLEGENRVDGEGEAQGFSFGFGGEDDSDVEVP